jgi:diguanylate cyclase (GGDEF)-like protein
MSIAHAPGAVTHPIVGRPQSVRLVRWPAALFRGRAPTPTLLLLVCGALLVVVGATATGQAALTSAHFSSALVDSVVGNDAATVRAFVNATVTPEDLTPGMMNDERAGSLAAQLGSLVSWGEVLRAEIRRPDGRILASSASGVRGRAAPLTDSFAAATRGDTNASMVSAGDDADQLGVPTGAATVLREYFPIMSGGDVYAVVAIWRDAQPVLARLDAARRDVVTLIVAAALIAGILLFLIFRASQARITRQAMQLVEATKRDALTGLPNHGTLVTMLADAIEEARRRGNGIAVMLLDVDGFRLLNDTHGHALGDEALVRVARLLERYMPEEAEIGRYGPDEFLIFEPSPTTTDLERAIARMRVALADVSLRAGSPDHLPITVSTGVCAYPQHGQSVTTLLSVAALTVKEAKVGGGDTTQVAGLIPDDAVAMKTFDVLNGLVVAVDTKDHYTKRHCEDVARYAVFIAEQARMDVDLIRTLDIAGQLHDVGKIGVPDSVLRKPGRLGTEELRVMSQHSTLGDLIVRDLPNIELVRAGVRHHHERWDGRGYPDRLAGEGIPLIARILAVADTFSAMTTTRPYRSAYSVERALQRLEGAGGSQLDPKLVQAFVHGLRTIPGAPMPRRPAPQSAQPWGPEQAVA